VASWHAAEREGTKVQGPERIVYLVLLGALGLVFGSFGNVVIWRLPRRESLASPGSHCPICGHAIRWYDNIPVISWLALRARCRDCEAPISPRYPAVEALSGALWVSAGVAFGVSVRAAFAVVLFYLLLLLAFIDLDTMRLPNPLVGLVAAVGVAGAVWAQVSHARILPLTDVAGPGWLSEPIVAASVGAASGGLLMLVITLLYERVRGSQGFGMGDVKLLAAVGPFLGAYTLLALFLGSVVAAAGGLALARGKGEPPLARVRFPFGPFLALGIGLAALRGPALVLAYLHLAGLG
jgi:leader peptidase (prepilin peptidase)/N-methyltransferase